MRIVGIICIRRWSPSPPMLMLSNKKVMDRRLYEFAGQLSNPQAVGSRKSLVDYKNSHSIIFLFSPTQRVWLSEGNMWFYQKKKGSNSK